MDGLGLLAGNWTRAQTNRAWLEGTVAIPRATASNARIHGDFRRSAPRMDAFKLWALIDKEQLRAVE